MPIALVCLDADDTLWGHESFFQDAARRYHALLAPFDDSERIEAQLTEAEDRNLHLYGYGVKGFTLSMIESALEIAGDALPAATVRQILDIGRDLLRHPIEPLPGVRETLPLLAARARLVLVTKGDLIHQEFEARRLGPRRPFRRRRDRQREDRRHLYKSVRALRRAGASGGNGRQFAALRHMAGAGSRRLGGLHPEPI